MHTPIRATYPMMPLADFMSILVNLRQNENEDLLEITWGGLRKKVILIIEN